jgi:hypothetical protein
MGLAKSGDSEHHSAVALRMEMDEVEVRRQPSHDVYAPRLGVAA